MSGSDHANASPAGAAIRRRAPASRQALRSGGRAASTSASRPDPSEASQLRVFPRRIHANDIDSWAVADVVRAALSEAEWSLADRDSELYAEIHRALVVAQDQIRRASRERGARVCEFARQVVGSPFEERYRRRPPGRAYRVVVSRGATNHVVWVQERDDPELMALRVRTETATEAFVNTIRGIVRRWRARSPTGSSLDR